MRFIGIAAHTQIDWTGEEVHTQKCRRLPCYTELHLTDEINGLTHTQTCAEIRWRRLIPGLLHAVSHQSLEIFLLLAVCLLDKIDGLKFTCSGWNDETNIIMGRLIQSIQVNLRNDIIIETPSHYIYVHVLLHRGMLCTMHVRWMGCPSSIHKMASLRIYRVYQ